MRETLSIIPLFLIILISGCSTGFINPPERETIEEYQTKISNDPQFLQQTDIAKLEENERQAFVFLTAKHFLKQNKKRAACQRFNYLYKDRSFALRELALIYTLKACDYNSARLKLLWNKDFREIKPFYKEAYLEDALNLAKEKKLPEWIAQFTIDLVPFLETKKEKENLLNKNIFLLKSMKDNTALDELINKRAEVFPRYISSPKKDQYFDVGSSFMEVRKFRKARNYFRKIVRDNSFDLEYRLEAYNKIAFSYKLGRDKVRYAQELREATRWFEKELSKSNIVSPLSEEDLRDKLAYFTIKLARALWTVGDSKEAKWWLEHALKISPLKENARARAYFVLGSIELEKKNRNGARDLFQKGLLGNNLEEETFELLSWNLLWSHYLDGETEETLSLLNRFLDMEISRAYQNKLTFWKAKILDGKNDNEEAQKLFKKLIKEDSFGYYGVAASIESKIPLEPTENNSFNTNFSPFPILNWLVNVSEFDLAKSFLKSKEDQYKTAGEVKFLLPLYHFAKWYDGGISKYFSLSEEDRMEIEEDVLPAIFPTPYIQEFSKVSDKMNVPEDFMYSIARQESAFNAKVRSWADAFGLLQVTPEKAKSLAKKIKVPYQGFQDLYDVETNLLLGSLLLKNLINNFKGKFIPTVAAYNAGKSPLYRWMKTRHRKDPFEFIESIPYKETRNYIKLVLRNLVSYRRMLKKEWNEDKEFFTKNLLKN